MDANFTFPARPKAIPRPAPAQSPTEPVNRESNALRASVLDAALELGLGANGSVANWMFNNTLEEEPEEMEEEDPIGKGPLSATSDEYGAYSTPPTSTSSHSDLHSSHSDAFHRYAPSPLASPQVHFPETPAPPAAPAPANKLRKQRRDGGYESDGGYVSDGPKRSRTKSKTAKDAPPAATPPLPISDPMELIPLSKEERKRKKKATKASKDHGAETDTEDVGKKTKSPPKPKKTKKPSADGAAAAGYETDDGYVSSSGKPKKGRSRFFSLRKKSSDSQSEAMPEPVPPMPEPPREVFDLPIASRFATTLAAGGSATPSRSETPLLPPSRPFASRSGSSSASSSSANSLMTPADQESFGTGSLSMNPGDTTDITYSLTVTPSPEQQLPSSRSQSPLPPTSNKPVSKFAISYPLNRSAGPSSPGSANAQARHVPSPITLAPAHINNRAASPMGSPYVLLTPINTNTNTSHSQFQSQSQAQYARAPSPSPIGSTDYIVPSRAGSPLPPSPNVLAYYDVPPPSPPPGGPLPRAPGGRGPPPSAARDVREPALGVARLRSISQDRGGRSPIPGQRAISPVPSSAHPTSGGGWGAGGINGNGHAYGGSRDRALSPNPNAPPMSANAHLTPMFARDGAPSPVSPGVQRGRAAPFPTQPVGSGRAHAGAGGPGGAGGGNGGVGPGLAARAKVQRYRDLYAIDIPPTPRGARAPSDESDDEVGIHVEEWERERDPYGGYEGEGAGEREGEGDEVEEMLNVLGRFRDPGTGAREQAERRMGTALERNNSGALRPGVGPRGGRRSPTSVPTSAAYTASDAGDDAYSDDDEASRYPDEDKTAGRGTMYRFEHDGHGRETMYSTPSRVSFMDLEKSEKARGQLVDRVGVMFDLSGRERAAVPPVPKLPSAALLAAGPGGNRF
ncbi:hypothetical protein C8R47DRAFT_1326241 [Mycena vitilis]|nr:hypothetical protein C8R47DRAFT_1326241 [Mycena vitilis]